MSVADTIPVPDAAVADLRARLQATRWGPVWPGLDAWEAGTDQGELRRLVEHWADGYDWRAVERSILALPSADVLVDGVPVHAFHFRAERSDAPALMLVNGWPSTSLELVDLAQRLSEPGRFGGDPDAGFHVVVPSLPGFPFSPQRPQRDSAVHEVLHELMQRLGYTRYGAQGGDLGAGIVSRLAEAHPDALTGIHLMAVAAPVTFDRAGLSADELAALEAADQWARVEGAYQHQQQTRPLSLAPALSDSPVGLLGWIVEKYRAWSDSGGVLASRFSDDFLLTQASLYWFTNSISTSLRPYFECGSGITARVARVSVPTAVAVFPADLAQPPRSWAERTYDVDRYTVMPAGGHFAPHEEPELLAADITAFFAARA